jgi:diketogulonate reductase-like aldo/keto reductase
MLDRRTFLRRSGSTLVALSLTRMPSAIAASRLPRRPIPSTGEDLPIVGLGNSAAFRSGDLDLTRQLLGLLLDYGGSYVDVSGDSRLTVARVAARQSSGSDLFLGTYTEKTQDGAVREDLATVRNVLGGRPLDLVLTRFVDDFARRSDEFLALKDAGVARYLGVARSNREYYPGIISLMESGAVDFVQVNYSMLEPEAADRLLPLAMEKGIAVVINRPFLNGQYFALVNNQELPEWAIEFDCSSWAQFSLKYILAHPAVNCVLTETSNPEHAVDNFQAGFGKLPDAKTRERMQLLIQNLA